MLFMFRSALVAILAFYWFDLLGARWQLVRVLWVWISLQRLELSLVAAKIKKTSQLQKKGHLGATTSD